VEAADISMKNPAKRGAGKTAQPQDETFQIPGMRFSIVDGTPMVFTPQGQVGGDRLFQCVHYLQSELALMRQVIERAERWLGVSGL
jgi:hypothetical protein